MSNHGYSDQQWEYFEKRRQRILEYKAELESRYSYKLSPYYRAADCCEVMPLVTTWRGQFGKMHRIKCEVCGRKVTVAGSLDTLVDCWNKEIEND